MTQHLLQKKKPCPQVLSDIELTDDVKEHILANRVYKIKKQIEPIEKKKSGKATIPKTLRLAVWDKYVGLSVGQVKCLCCNMVDIHQGDFECGHIEAEAKGGPTNIDNLLPICSTCNRSMHTRNLNAFRLLLVSKQPIEEKHQQTPQPTSTNTTVNTTTCKLTESKLPIEPYRCPRCGYNTIKKPCMRYHLMVMKRMCPATLSDIVLTEDIKEHILKERVYHMKDEAKTITQVIAHDEVKNYRHVGRLYGQLAQSDFMVIVDNLTKAIRGSQRNEFLEELNVIYDSKRKRIKVYSGKWEEYLVVHGITHLLNTIIDYYLEAYEIYLMRKITKSRNVKEVSSFTQCLHDYYQFIGCFDIDPYCKGKYDNKIMFNKDAPEYDIAPVSGPEDTDTEADEDSESGYTIATRFTAMYIDIYGSITNTQRKSKQAEMLEVIKSNSKNNIMELDKDILDLVNIDTAFKERIFERGMIEE